MNVSSIYLCNAQLSLATNATATAVGLMMNLELLLRSSYDTHSATTTQHTESSKTGNPLR